MAKLFDMDNPVWRFMGMLADIFFLTLLWAVFSIPVITAGAASTALYYVTLKMAENRAGYILPAFWKGFKENFGLSTLVWVIMLLLGAFFGWNLYYYYHAASSAAVVMFWLFAVFAVLYVFMLVLLFPLGARLDAGVRKLFFMTFMVCLKNFSWVLLMVVTAFCMIALGVFVFWPLLFFSAGGIAYIHSLILAKIIFPKYGWSE